jgi:hypothetical protein
VARVGELSLQHVGVVEDDTEQIVEIVGHAASELGHVLQAARLHELGLEQLAFPFGVFALQSAHENFAHPPQEGDVFFGPRFVGAHRVESEEPDHAASRAEGQYECGADRLFTEDLPFGRSFVGQIRHALDVNDFAAANARGEPRQHTDR